MTPQGLTGGLFGGAGLPGFGVFCSYSVAWTSSLVVHGLPGACVELPGFVQC